MKDFLKNNALPLLLYLVAASVALYFLLSYPKAEINLYINQYVGNWLANLFFYYITYFGDGRMAGVIILGIMLYNLRLGIYSLFSFLSATLLANTLKYFYFDQENRPFYHYQYIQEHQLNLVEGVDMHIHNSFPSGHATQAFAILMCLAFTAKKQWVKLLYFMLALLTSFSRVYLSQHWLVDITAGSAIGLLFSILFYYVLIHRNKFSKLDRPLYKFRSS